MYCQKILRLSRSSKVVAEGTVLAQGSYSLVDYWHKVLIL